MEQQWVHTWDIRQGDESVWRWVRNCPLSCIKHDDYSILWDYLREHVHDCFLGYSVWRRNLKEFIYWFSYSTDATFISSLWSFNPFFLAVLWASPQLTCGLSQLCLLEALEWEAALWRANHVKSTGAQSDLVSSRMVEQKALKASEVERISSGAEVISDTDWWNSTINKTFWWPENFISDVVYFMPHNTRRHRMEGCHTVSNAKSFALGVTIRALHCKDPAFYLQLANNLQWYVAPSLP